MAQIEKAAHIMTERQKKGALSSAKKVKHPKNVLIKNEIEYWPNLNAENCERFVNLLETSITDGDAKDNLTIGLQSTLRHLKKADENSMLVMADEISPRWFGKQLIAMCLHRNQSLKIVIIPKLKDVTKTVLKIPTIIFAVKKSATFDEFYQQLDTHPEFLKNYYTIKQSCNLSIKRKKQKPQVDEGPVVELLKKPCDSSRSFMPMDIEDTAKTQPMPKLESGDFISLSKYTDKASNMSIQPAIVPLYRPIKIARIVGNPNRKKTR